MAEEWAKLHTSILGDPKLMRAARKGAKGLEMLPWIIVFAKAEGRNGELTVSGEPAEPEDIAAYIPGNPVKAVAACMASCVDVGTLEEVDGVLCFTRWDQRQSVRASESREAVNDRVRRHRERKRTETTDAVTDETTVTTLQNESNALDIDRDLDRDGDLEKDQPPLSAGADVVVHSAPVQTPGTDLVTGSSVAVRRTAEAIIAKLGEVMASVGMGTRERLNAEEQRKAKAEIVFAYWAKRLNHETSIYDDRRRNRLLARLRENGGDVHELLYAIDGALRDDNLMGRKNDSTRKYDGIETIFRDRAQVERLANDCPNWRAQKPHPIAVKYAEVFDEIASGAVAAEAVA